MTLKKILPLAALLAVVLPAGQAFAASKSKFRFEQATYVATEGQGHVDVTVTRVARKGHSKKDQNSTVSFAVTGGSASGADYSLTPAPSQLSFATNETTKTIRVDLVQDTDIEGLETIQLKLSAASSNALITNPRSTQVLIADDDGPTQVSLAPASQSVGEGTSPAVFYAVRSGDITGNSSVDYATSDGTAHAPGDYTAQPTTTVTFATGEYSKTINVPIVDDSDIEDAESFTVTLSNLGNAVFPNNAASVTGTATIVDNDSPPVFALDASSYEVNEDGSVDVTVSRGSNPGGGHVSSTDVFTVDWTTVDGTATNPADYLPGVDNTLEFDSTDDAETITISGTAATQIGLVDDTLHEDDETFGLALANPTSTSNAPATLGTPSAATVTIHDNDPATPDTGSNPGSGNTGGGTGTTGSDSNTGSSTTAGGTPQGGVLGFVRSTCRLTIKVAKKQRLLKKKVLTLKLRSTAACKVGIATTIKQAKSKKTRHAQIVRALRFRGKTQSLSLQPNKAKTVKVKFTKRTLKAIKKALGARKRLVATVVVTERAGNAAATKRTLRIAIRR